MIYLFIFFCIVFYLYLVERKNSHYFYKQFIVWLPAFIFFVSLPAFQNGVGTDYETYFSYFYNNDYFLYKDKNEILYFYIVSFSNFLGDPQFQFIIVSIIQGFLFFYLMFLLKNKGYNSWLIFFIYFVCTGIYHNQMNGLRQFICVYLVLINFVFLYNRKFILFGSGLYISSLIHFSSLIPNFLIFILSFIKLNNKKILFLIFILSFGVYALNYKLVISELMSFFDLRYTHYLDTDYADAADSQKLITKFYYLPVIFIFWYLYIKDKESNHFFDFSILIFSATYFMFLQASDFSLMLRIWQYLNFFVVFPIYYVIEKTNGVNRFLILLYLILFYVLKVVFFATAEYEYFVYLGWF